LDDALTSMQVVFDSQAVQVTISRPDIVCKLFEMEIGPVDLGPTTFKRVIRHHGITRESIED
jgi:hypothetical protein